jgi:uncharacterized integral membrane protein (TIGR00697 family)
MTNASAQIQSNPGPDASLSDSHNPHALTKAQQVYFWLVAVNVTCLLVANIIGSKLFRLEIDLGSLGTIPVEHTMGMLPFPITFLLTDLVNEYFGKRAARRMAYISFAMAAFTWGLIYVARLFPTLTGIPGTATPEAFENIFGAAAIMYVASILAFLAGSMIDISLFAIFKKLTGGKLVWVRTTGSTIISQMFDSLLVTFLFFLVIPKVLGQASSDAVWILKTAATGYILKFFIAVALTPAVYGGRWALRRLFGLTPIPASES